MSGSDFELRIGEDVPDECKGCNQLTLFNSCKLSKHKAKFFDFDCPLDFLLCENCQYFCKIVKQDGSELDFGYCIEKGTDLCFQERACDCFTEYKGETNNE